jgi:hypothetical protein
MHAKLQEQNTSTAEQDALRAMWCNDSITVLPADGDNDIELLVSEDSHAKMQIVLPTGSLRASGSSDKGWWKTAISHASHPHRHYSLLKLTLSRICQ